MRRVPERVLHAVPGATPLRLLRIALGGALLAWGSALPAQEDGARILLDRMTAAIRALNYQGSFVYEHGGQIDVLRIFHDGEDAGRERLVSMNGPRREVLRVGNSVTCLQAGSAATIFPNRVGTRLLPLVPDTRDARFGRLYAVNLGGEDRVAGYRARILDIVPRDGWRYGYRVWLDETTFMLLRSAVLDAAGRPLEQFMFVALDVGAKPKESDLAPSGGPGEVALPDEAGVAGAPRWRVSDLPPGFGLLRAQRPATGPLPAEHYIYTDGLATVSVYVEPRDPKLPESPGSASRRGVLSIYSRSEGPWLITALGDVPAATVQRIAASTVAAKPAAASAVP